MSLPFFTIPFTSYTATSEWTSFLRHLNQPGIFAQSNLNLIPQTISSRDSHDKRFWTNLYTTKADATDISSPARAQLRDWKCTLTLPTAISMLRDHGTLMVFVGPNWTTADREEAERTRRSEKVWWHCFVAFWKNGVWGVYDPSFVSGPLQSMEGLRLFRYMLEEMQVDGLVVDEVWVGGGGNKNSDCSEMSRQWVQDEVVSKMGMALGRWEGRDGWARVYDI